MRHQLASKMPASGTMESEPAPARPWPPGALEGTKTKRMLWQETREEKVLQR